MSPKIPVLIIAEAQRPAILEANRPNPAFLASLKVPENNTHTMSTMIGIAIMNPIHANMIRAVSGEVIFTSFL